MTTLALVVGTLFRAPEQKTSKAGRPFVTATIRTRDGDASTFWRVTAFSESAQAEVMRLGDGDGVSIQGPMRAELYRPGNGEPRVSLSIVADAVLALRQPERPAKDPGPRREAFKARCGRADPDLDDGAPF